MQYHANYRPCGGMSETYPAITVSAGHNMGEIYELLAEHNMTVVGGADPNVGLGGLLTGGGHSPISSEYGLAVDNTEQMWVVIPSRDLVLANRCQNEDLFWAFRGVSTARTDETQCCKLILVGWRFYFRHSYQCYYSRLSHANYFFREI